MNQATAIPCQVFTGSDTRPSGPRAGGVRRRRGPSRPIEPMEPRLLLAVIAVQNAVFMEGSGGGTTPAVFEVSLHDPPAGRTVTVDYATVPVTATSPADFAPTSGTLTFAPGGPTTQTVTVPVVADEEYEFNNEVFRIALTNPVNAVLARTVASGHVIDDDLAFVRATEAIVLEPDEGTVDAVFTVIRTGNTGGTTTVAYATSADTGDFVPTSGTLTFAPGETVKTVTVPVIGDTAEEAGVEQFRLNLTYLNRRNSLEDAGLGTVVDSDGANRTASYVAIVGPGARNEGDAGPYDAIFTVKRVGALDAPASVEFSTRERPGERPTHYTPVRATVRFAPGQETATAAVPIKPDGIMADDRKRVGNVQQSIFTVLENPSGVTPVTPGAVFRIADDDESYVVVDQPVAFEGDPDDPRTAVFTLTRVGSLGGEVRVPVGVDWVTFAPGERTKTLAVAIPPDTTAEPPTRAFPRVEFSHIVNAIGLTHFGDNGAFVIDDDPRPVVTAVHVNGTAWAQPLRDALAAEGLGHSTYGYAVPGGAAQLRAIPWARADQVSITFSQPVAVQFDDLRVLSAADPAAPLALADEGGAIPAFAYDPATNTATWTLKQPVSDDSLLLDLDGDTAGAVADAAGGARLDGEWADGADTFPSGGSPLYAVDFRFRVNLLGGDATGDRAVNALDLADVKRRLNRSAADPGSGAGAYSPFADVTGDARINALDLAAVKQRLNRRLPPITPPPSPAALPGRPMSRAGDGTPLADRPPLFGDRDITAAASHFPAPRSLLN